MLHDQIKWGTPNFLPDIKYVNDSWEYLDGKNPNSPKLITIEQ